MPQLPKNKASRTLVSIDEASEEFDSRFDQVFEGSFSVALSTSPPTNIRYERDKVTVYVDLPDFRADQLRTRLAGGCLLISTPAGDIRVVVGIEVVEREAFAELADGMLVVALPIRQPGGTDLEILERLEL